MNLPKSFQFLAVLVSTLSPTIVTFASLPPRRSVSDLEWKVSLKFPPVDDRGAPSQTSGGGTRGSSCIDGNIPLTPLMPSQNNLGKTVAANPTLYWYVPKNTAQSGEFSLTDEKGNQVYLTTFKLPSSPGVIQLKLPANFSLQIGKYYRWNFAIICDFQDRAQDKFVNGLLQRTQLSSFLKSRLDQAAPLERAKIYAESKIWQETMNTVAQLRHEKPAEWEELLKSVGLGAIAKEPFLDCCTSDR
ncbi:MAG: DUF928 domain-containing protein [Nostoc sp.]|uniref:DUF928 domain-containing protein n=1 Tax=unclassified Nostoc TaxID=2593658 RepID=UPI0025E26DAF|nr:DUF928 domain-containing protein [Nostoc sp. NMS9]MBN3944726.1 DUF928 domain-containing protein [Nostoc sp. NMS9]